MKRFFVLVLILGITVFPFHLYAQSSPVETLGNVQSINKNGNTLLIKTKEAEARVWVYSPSIIRVNISKKFNREDSSYAVIQKEADLNYTETDSKVAVSTMQMKLVINKSPLRFSFFTADGKALSSDDPSFGTNWQNSRVTNYRKLYQDERFIGLGEKKRKSGSSGS